MFYVQEMKSALYLSYDFLKWLKGIKMIVAYIKNLDKEQANQHLLILSVNMLLVILYLSNVARDHLKRNLILNSKVNC